MTKYQEFLEKIGVISETQFNEVVKEFPDVDISLLRMTDYDDNGDINTIVEAFIDVILENYKYVYIDELDFETRTIYLVDVESLEDLESIKQKLSNWDIVNYGELREYLLQKEEDDKKDRDYQKKMNLISINIDNIPIEDLREFISKYY